MDHKFLLSDFNKTIKKIGEILKENEELKNNIRQIEQILNLSTNSLVSAKKAGISLIVKCDCQKEILIIGKKCPGQIFKINCFHCQKEILTDKKPQVLIKL